jgi:hypothetical protein
VAGRARLWLLPTLLLVCLPSLWANQRAFGWCQLGGQQVQIAGLLSTSFVQQSFRSCSVAVYNSGLLTLATIYSDNSNTPLANPFTASITGYWAFYANSTAPNNRYDVSLSGGGISGTITYPDIELTDLASGGITAINSQTGPTLTIQTGTSGSSFNISNPSSNVIQVNCPGASSTASGCLSSTDWSTFNGKGGALSFTLPLVNTAGTISINFPFGISQGGTGATTQTTAFNALSPLTTKGDFLSFNGTNNIRVPIGTDTWIPFADHTQGVGWAWGACPFCQFTTPLPVADGGTAQSSGTSGGVECWTSNSVLAASTLLVSGAPVIGGGSGACPSTTGAFSTYNGLTLAGQGFPAVLDAPTIATAQAATVGPSNLVASAAAGTYELCYYAVITRAATSTSSLTPAFGWNDGSSRSTASLVTANVPNFQADAANNVGDILTGCVTVYSAASQNITFTFTYASSGATTMQYSYTVTAKRIL